MNDEDAPRRQADQGARAAGRGKVSIRAGPHRTGIDGVVGIGWPRLPRRSETLVLALQVQFNATQWWTPERLLAQQLAQAQRVIRHAARTVPFYRERLAGLSDLAPGRLTMERFRAIPPLTRRDIQEAGKDLWSGALPPGHGTPRPSRTSGSSGRPIEFLNTFVTALMAAALTLRGHLWHNRDLSQKNLKVRVAFTTGTRERWAPVPWSGTSVQVSGKLPIDELFAHLLDEDPAYLEAHPHQILGLLQRSEQTGQRPGSLREARSFGETLDPWLREKCRALWGVPMVDNYSAEEFGTIAHQCPASTNLHVMAESVLLEVLDEDGAPCRPGESGRVVITSLNNFASPFIREELGDVARVGAPCACGRGLPVIERVMGRERNLFVRPDGGRVLPELYREFSSMAPVRQFQLTQKTVELIEARLAVTRPLGADEEQAIRGFIRDALGYAFDVRFIYVDEIPREPSGKYQDYRSEVSAARVAQA